MNDDDHWGPPSGKKEPWRAPKAKRPRPVAIPGDGWRSDVDPVAPGPRRTFMGPRAQTVAYVGLGAAVWLAVGLAFLGRASGDEIDTRPDPQPIRAVVPAVDGPDGVVAETCRRYDLPTELCDLSERCVGAEGFQAGAGRVTLVLRSSELSCARTLGPSSSED